METQTERLKYTYVHVLDMATKTLTITEDAYDILKSRKKPTESFSEVIVRLSGKRPLASFYGVLGEEAGKALAKEIAETRRAHAVTHKERMKRYAL